MFNISNHAELANKLDELIDKDIDNKTQFTCSHDEWRVITTALQHNFVLKLILESVYDMASDPTGNPLEVGFRHTPLSDKEILERYRNTCKFIAEDIKITLDSMEK